jgi:mRNA interferase HigB
MDSTLRIIARKTIREFWDIPQYSDSQRPLRSWYWLARNADWQGPDDVKRQFRSASIIAGNRVVFNIAGNKYRLVVKFNYPYKIGYIRFIGTHKQYDQIDVENI